ncbi:protein ORD-like [Episyrphus balteatus]|uniref:protein ORD-like n=1 Tax=Episyrphus balteatus TaxID=286459 RepID=UPI0024853A22|nr:protein ORD-like [Episyrphus balteatus]
MRTGNLPDTIYYYFDGEQYIDNIRVYHERCRIDVTSLFPCLNKVFSNENKNLMSIWINNECPELRATGEKSYELLANFMQVSHLRSNAEIRNIEKLSHSMLTIQKHTERLERRTFVDVANNIGKIFKYITFEKYDVQFSIPLAEQNIQMDQLKWEDMDLSRAETYVLNVNEKTSALWNTVEPGLKYLLKIAQQIALAENLGQHCIIIKDTSLLQNYQNQEMIKEAIIEDDGINKEANWKNKNFLNQIINVCNEMEIMLFINYHSELPLPPKNATIIKCRKCTENDNSDLIYVPESLKSMNLQEFIELVVPPNTRK